MTNNTNILKHIEIIARKISIKKEDLELYGNYKAKITKYSGEMKAKLILVTSINPTPAGEGKTTTSIGLHDSFRRLKKNSILTLREPSMGPFFGFKGGATGGGKALVVPEKDINLHFTGDFHAITSANNLIAAKIDNHIYWGNKLKIKNTTFLRSMDMNDRSLRDIEVKIKNNMYKKTSYQITAASEVMAIICLSKSEMDLRKKLDKIIIGYDDIDKPIFLKKLNITDDLLDILTDALKPNIVQTIENNPVLIHGGPFANIAHGCNSIIATKTAMQLSDYVITEAGFGSELGAEKFINIKCRELNVQPSIVVIVATLRALKMHGGVSKSNLQKVNIEAIRKGILNLQKHIDIIRNFNINFVISINHYTNDDEEELNFISKWANINNYPLSISHIWSKGSKGGEKLAKLVLDNLKDTNVNFTYNINDSIKNKIQSIASKIYGASNINFSDNAAQQIKKIEKLKLDKQYICIAKTPLSITDDPKIIYVPKKWTLNINDISLSNGAGLIVVHCGKIIMMPGLPKI